LVRASALASVRVSVLASARVSVRASARVSALVSERASVLASARMGFARVVSYFGLLGSRVEVSVFQMVNYFWLVYCPAGFAFRPPV
jgi:hypothetical protein